MKHYDFLLDYLTDKILGMFKELQSISEKLLTDYRKDSLEESKEEKDTKDKCLEKLRSNQSKIYEEFWTNNRLLEHYKMLLACYSSCKRYTMNDRLNHVCKNTLSI